MVCAWRFQFAWNFLGLWHHRYYRYALPWLLSRPGLIFFRSEYTRSEKVKGIIALLRWISELIWCGAMLPLQNPLLVQEEQCRTVCKNAWKPSSGGVINLYISFFTRNIWQATFWWHILLEKIYKVLKKSSKPDWSIFKLKHGSPWDCSTFLDT